MYTSNIRIGSKIFTDFKKFPYGFKKSGDFSISEATTLSSLGDTLFNLEFGSLQPVTAEEQHFVQAARGLIAPETSIERVWLKYVRLARTRKNFYTMHSSTMNQVDESESIDYDDSDLEVEA